MKQKGKTAGATGWIVKPFGSGPLQTNDAPGLMPRGMPSIILAPLCGGLCALNARITDPEAFHDAT
jgi:hypothetical protein